MSICLSSRSTCPIKVRGSLAKMATMALLMETSRQFSVDLGQFGAFLSKSWRSSVHFRHILLYLWRFSLFRRPKQSEVLAPVA